MGDWLRQVALNRGSRLAGISVTTFPGSEIFFARWPGRRKRAGCRRWNLSHRFQAVDFSHLPRSGETFGDARSNVESRSQGSGRNFPEGRALRGDRQIEIRESRSQPFRAVEFFRWRPSARRTSRASQCWNLNHTFRAVHSPTLLPSAERPVEGAAGWNLHQECPAAFRWVRHAAWRRRDPDSGISVTTIPGSRLFSLPPAIELGRD